MVDRKYDNAIETIALMISTSATPDQLIQSTQDLRRLLNKAVDFWTTDWQKTPVYIEVQANCETNPRYAIIKSWQTPDEDGPIGQPFHNALGNAMTDFTLVLERGHWLSDEPGTATCIEVSGAKGSRWGQKVFTPLISADDARATNNVNTITLTGELIFGTGGGLATYQAGIRFRNVDVPQGATIRVAYIRFEAEGTDAVAMDVDIDCEDADNSDAFTTYANLVGRPRTGSSVNWVTPAWTAGTFYDTPSLVSPVQDVVDRAGWTSGNNLTIFLDDNASTGLRQAGSVDTDPGDRRAWLFLAYEVTENGGYATGFSLGKERTCALDAFIANKQTNAALTHIYRFDAAALMAPGNMIAETDFDFFPAVPANPDTIYFGVNNAADPGPFCSLVFNIGSPQDGNLDLIWQYHNGAGYQPLTVQDNTDANGAMTGEPFDSGGVNTVHWEPPSDWVTRTINGVTGYWVRVLVNATTGVTNVTQQDDAIYTVIWGSYQVDGGDVEGDIPAVSQSVLENVSSGNAGDFHSWRLIAGLRSDVRGESFSAYINLADRGNQSGVTVSVTGSSAFLTYVFAPTGRVVHYNPGAAIEALGYEARVLLNAALAEQYFGIYHAYMRVNQVSGISGDFTAQLRIDAGTAFVTDEVDVLSVASGIAPAVVDFGQIRLPGLTAPATGDQLESLYIDIWLSHTRAAAGNLYLYDLILIPVDEWSGEFVYNDAIEDILQRGRVLEIDSVINPKAYIRALLRDGSATGAIYNDWRTVANGELIHQANASQKMWVFCHLPSSFYDTPVSNIGAYPEITHAVDVNAARRYFSGRGSR
jgi:hypothetical protein